MTERDTQHETPTRSASLTRENSGPDESIRRAPEAPAAKDAAEADLLRDLAARAARATPSYQTAIRQFQRWCAECGLSIADIGVEQLETYARSLEHRLAPNTAKQHRQATRWWLGAKDGRVAEPLHVLYEVARAGPAYQVAIRRFDHWCAECGLSATDIGAEQLETYARSLEQRFAPSTAKDSLKAARWWLKNRDTRPRRRRDELRTLLLRIPGWREEDEEFRAALVMLAPAVTGNTNLKKISRFSGVPLAEVETFAARLLAQGIWQADGSLRGNWDDPESGWLAIVFDAMVATGKAERSRDDGLITFEKSDTEDLGPSSPTPETRT